MLTDQILIDLETGKKRVVEKISSNSKNEFKINADIKEEIVSLFKNPKQQIKAGEMIWEDKLSWHMDHSDKNYRACPGSWIRRGVYIGENCIFMPCFVNIGAQIGSKTMIDSGATIGACSYIGKNCHISANTVIAGVLEPAQAKPAIIDDNCFIGSGCLISEGVVVEEGCVIGAGVSLTSSTKIINRDTGETSYGSVPKGSVVVPGSYPSNGININCAIIIKNNSTETQEKTSLNDNLRD